MPAQRLMLRRISLRLKVAKYIYLTTKSIKEAMARFMKLDQLMDLLAIS